ncbi:MAG TPA: hypothetical protein VNB24_05620 [Acidimicrobiales bacterium]|nr:hypothetical protein [Acidimicrobiales bacterium]
MGAAAAAVVAGIVALAPAAHAAEPNPPVGESGYQYTFTDDLFDGGTIFLSPDTQQMAFQTPSGRQVPVSRDATQISIFLPTAIEYPTVTDPATLVEDIVSGGPDAIGDRADEILSSGAPTSVSACEVLTDSTCERRFIITAFNNRRITVVGVFDTQSGLFVAAVGYRGDLYLLGSLGTCADDVAGCAAPPTTPEDGPPVPLPDGSQIAEIVHELMKTEPVKEITKIEPVKELLKTEPIKGLLKP